jgi:hypothetical protein
MDTDRETDWGTDREADRNTYRDRDWKQTVT